MTIKSPAERRPVSVEAQQAIIQRNIVAFFAHVNLFPGAGDHLVYVGIERHG